MRILHVAHESPLSPAGGLGIHLRGLCGEQCRDHDVTVLGASQDWIGGLYSVGSGGDEKLCRAADWKQPKRYRVCHPFNDSFFPLQGFSGTVSELVTYNNYWGAADEVLRDETWDVVHLHDAYLCSVAHALARSRGAKLVMTAHLSQRLSGSASGAAGGQSVEAYRLTCQRELAYYHRADALIAVSQSYADAIADIMRVPKGKIHAIHNAVDAAAFEAVVPDNTTLRDMFGDKPVAVMVGRMTADKGVADFVEAARALPDWGFLLVSSMSPTIEATAPLERLVDDAAHKLPNLRWWRDAGFDLGKWAVLKAATVGVVPSHHEPFGIVALEWMAAGVPLIVSDRDGLSEFCDAGNATMIEPSAVGIVEAIEAHKDAPDRCTKALATARGKTWSKVAKQVEAVYRGMTRRRVDHG